MQIGDAVYSPSLQQVYAVVGFDDTEIFRLQLKNIDNYTGNIVTMRPCQVMPYPTSWKNYEHYNAMAKKIAGKM